MEFVTAEERGRQLEAAIEAGRPTLSVADVALLDIACSLHLLLERSEPAEPKGPLHVCVKCGGEMTRVLGGHTCPACR